MKLRNDIFLRVALSILLPLTILVLAATYYAERRYQEEVQAELAASLASLVAEIDRRIVYERETFSALATAPAIEQYIPVMQAAADGDLHPEFFQRTENINTFLEAFQKIVPSMNTLRVLDAQANTLVKVRFGQSSPASFDGIESFPFAEEEIDDEQYIDRLYELPNDEISVTLLTQTRLEQDDDTSLPMLDYILPMSREGHFVGYLVANMLGEQINRILDFSQRPRNAKILIAEINPEEKDRHEVILYDDSQSLNFTDIKSQERRLKDALDKSLYEAIKGEIEGYVISDDKSESIYFLEYMPYPDLLAHWVVMLRIDQNAIAAPFRQIRIASLLLAGIGLIVSLWLAGMIASHVARPVTQLAKTIKDYAKGRNSIRASSTSGVVEIEQLTDSFNYMADTLDKAAVERDHAQHIMLQQAKLASIGQMAAGIGHELNNPLNNILTLSKLLERNSDCADENSKQDIISLREETLRASGIVQGILNFARQVPPSFSHFKLSEWIADTLALVQQQANEHAVVLHMPDDLELFLYGDRSQLQQVLINLLLNAIQASARDSSIEIQVYTDANNISVSVSDKGIGIDEDELDNVFDPFYSSKQVGEGYGLGLSISMGIMEQHGGMLKIENNSDVGVLVTMTLPIKNEQA
ncbi:MAG: sensor histidine kinase [Sulfuriflexus sp.]|nr:sensor histidine kinase [Sulfuriflexus sp.]